MDELFSCRNCIQNCGQSLTAGLGAGFCLRHTSVIWNPDRTTCKYLHRKDLPKFVVDEGVSEHASEFANFSGMADLFTHQPIKRLNYSEQFSWERKLFDPLTNVLAQYHKSSPAWVFVESFTGGMDGRRSIAHGCLIRRYMDHCDTWKSSYRLVLAFLQEVDDEPRFRKGDLAPDSGESTYEEALWDLVFIRLSLIQEYGWHAGLDQLKWVTDSLNGALTEFNWPKLQTELGVLKGILTEAIIKHAQDEGEFFDRPDVRDERP